MLLKSLVTGLLFYFIFAPQSFATISADHIELDVIAESEESLAKGQIGIHYRMDPHWHIYWKNPGDSGAAPKFMFDGQPVSSIQWPYPKRIPVSHLVNYGYEEDVVIFLDLAAPITQKTLSLEWLVCKVDCVPGFAEVKLSPETVLIRPELWQRFRKRLPQQQKAETAHWLETTEKNFSFQLTGKALKDLKELHVFPDGLRGFATQAPVVEPQGENFTVRVPRSSDGASMDSTHFTAVAEYQDGTIKSFQWSVEQKQDLSLWLWGLVLAFTGGLILNLMPCVFPVLFLKAYSFLKTDDKKAIQKSSWLYSFGVLVSFFLLGLIIVLLNLSGQKLGWGFQLQNPYFVGGLIVLFFVMSLNFLDVLTFDNMTLPRFLNPLMSTDFGTGVLAVIVASPCTAPFMGTALGLTLTLPPVQALAIFMALGAGLAVPILVLAHIPALVKWLPQSGAWMVTLKRLMALPLLLTCAWLTWVFYLQVSVTKASEHWAPYNQETIEAMVKERPVFIDFTAAWCITCQVNKQTVLNSDEILQVFKDNNVYLVRADWTNYNQEITQALSRRGRNSVPLYVYKEKNKDEVKLPEILTPSMIKNLFNKETE